MYQIDAFADELFKGNPSAVYPLAEWLPDIVMQEIAAENNLSETAFIVEESEGYRIRWFTPTTEVSLCGHATLAAAFVLFQVLQYTEETIEFNSASGPLQVYRENDWLVMNFPTQPARSCSVPDRLTEALGIVPVDLMAAEDYLAILVTRKQSLVSNQTSTRFPSSTFAVLLSPHRETLPILSAVFSRLNFGIDEEPVTGSAHCTLAPYWSARLSKRKLSAQQLSQRGGQLRCEVKDERVLIAGKAIKYLEGRITLTSQ